MQFPEKINLVAPLLVGRKINILVADAMDPSNFWIHLISPEHSKALNLLTIEIEYASILFIKHTMTILMFTPF